MTIEFPTYDGVEVFILPPPGYEVDFENPRRQRVLEHILIFSLMGLLAFVALLQRFYSKMFLSHGLQVDDYFIFLGWVASIATQGLMTTSLSKGTFCIHSFEMPMTGYETHAFYAFLTAPIVMLTNSFTKLSLLAFYLQLSPQRWFRISVWSTIAFVIVSCIIIVCFLIFGCSPVHKAWDFKTEGSCLNLAIFYIATAAANIFTDCILFVLPIPMLYGLRMPVMQKLGAMLVFSIGTVTVATSVVRLVLLLGVLKSKDHSWDGCHANVWTFIESNLFIICASMPTLRKFFKHFMPRLMGSSIGRSNSSYNTGGTSGGATQSGAMSRRRGKRKSYARFSPEETELDVRDISGRGSDKNGKGKGKVKGGFTVTASPAMDMDERDGIRDDHSDKAILPSPSTIIHHH